MRSLFLEALACRNTGRPPIWLMRQAGRYMPEYRALRAKHSFMEMCKTPELAMEVTQLPIRAFGFDAAILFSDILVVAEALGVGVQFVESRGPVIERPVRTAQDIASLPQVTAKETLSYVAQAIRLLKPALHVPLIGFCGAPFTVASYMVEGGSSRTLLQTKKWLLTDPRNFHLLMQRITDLTLEYLQLQIAAGVDAIQIFDSWANFLAFPQFEEFSQAYICQLLAGIKSSGIPAIVFSKGSAAFAHALAQLSPSAISMDWNCHLASLRRSIPHPIALQGNLDPDILYAPSAMIKKEASRLLKSMHGDKGYIFNLGHGILPDVPVDAVKVLVETVKG